MYNGYLNNGEMAEWSIALPWKGSVRQRTEGSNPSFSANLIESNNDGKF